MADACFVPTGRPACLPHCLLASPLTCCAAPVLLLLLLSLQSAFVLSIPRRAMSDETQETLRTSTFPSGACLLCVLCVLCARCRRLHWHRHEPEERRCVRAMLRSVCPLEAFCGLPPTSVRL